MLTPHDIEQYPLGKAAFGGYKCEDVDNFLDTVAADYQKLYDENLALTQKITVLAEKIGEYRKDEDFLKNAMVEAQRIVDNTIREAQDKADIVISEANIKAAGIIGDTEKRATELKDFYEHLKAEVSNFRNQLLITYKSHIEIISALPTNERYDGSARSAVEQPAPAPAKPAVEDEVYANEETAQEPVSEPDAPAPAEPVAVADDMGDLANAIGNFDPSSDDDDTFNTVDFE